MDAPELAARLSDRFTEVLEARQEVTVTVVPEELLAALTYLRDDPDLRFEALSDVTCADWPALDPRFWVAYHLLSRQHRHRLRVKVGLPAQPDPPHVPSVTPLYPTANWLEREVFDFFGVIFEIGRAHV